MLEEVNSALRQSRRVVIDVETTGLDWRTKKICGYVLTFGPAPEDSYYIPVRHESGPNFDPTMVRNMLVSAQTESRHWVGHNIAFDLGFLHAEGITLNGTFEDTMINAALLDEFASSFSLESCADAAGVQGKKGQAMYEHIAATFGLPVHRNRMGEYWKLPADDAMAVEYATGDGTTTWQLCEYQRPRIERDELVDVHKVECDLIPVLNRMTMRGIKVDEERLQKFQWVLRAMVEKAMTDIGEDLNTRSSAQIRKYLEKNGCTNWPTTDKGNPSFAEEWLKTHEPGRRIINVRKAQNMLNSFVEPMLERHLYKGRVHATFNQLKSDSFGTVTGRLSSSNPNLQQVPKRNKGLGILFRSIFVPDRGMLWGSADYSQAEPRLLAHYSDCKVLVDGYNQKPSVDAHTAVAVAANIDRDSGKRLNQALLTGAGTRKVAEMLGGPMDEAMKIVDKYFEAMPEIRTLQARASKVMKGRGFVRSILGRRSRLEARGYEYKAVNRLLQCSNADMIKVSMVKIDALCRSAGGIDMLNNVHDSIDFQYTADKEEVYREALRIMCDFPQIKVPLEVEEDSGPDWAWASYGEDDWRKVMTEKGMI